jgi:dihydropteroate synthase
MTTGAMTSARPRYSLRVRGETRQLGDRTWLMGILNVTPDSFSDGGRHADPGRAVEHGLSLFALGADIVDVGGESTRPGSTRVEAAEEIRRVVPALRGLRAQGAGLLSIDTTRSEVARAALEAGADIVNDVSGFRFDPELPRVVAESGAPAVLMHLRGDFATMHETPRYADVMGEITAELRQSLALAREAGIEPNQLVLDPGIGFAKNAAHSLEVLRRLPELHALGRALLVGPSRKSFIGKALEGPAAERQFGTAAAVAACVLAGAHVVRVHDVREMAQVARLCDAILGSAA